MDMAIDNTLEFMVNIESIKCVRWSAFEHYYLLSSNSKSHNSII